MTESLTKIRHDFTQRLSQISRFWGFPKGMGAIFAVLYLSPDPLSLDDIAGQTGLTKGAVSTEVRALARLGLVHRSSKLADRKDYYEAETDFYKSIRAILKERQNTEFDRAIASVREMVGKIESASAPKEERAFLLQRIRAMREFFDALDSLVRAVVRLESLGIINVQKILGVLK
jgi:HTH-type transcriptional regulator, glycine betaine synthesis regulator